MSHRSAAVVFGVLIAVSCAPHQAVGPEEALRRYIAAIENDQPRVAYSFLDEAGRKRVSEAQFVSRWKDLRPELQAQAAALKAALVRPPMAKAELSYPAGARAELSYQEGRWRLDRPVTISPRTATPLEAIQAFIQAVERREYQAVMPLLAKPVRERIERDIQSRLTKLKEALGQEIEVTGSTARLQYNTSLKIELTNEEGQWRVVDVD